MAINHNQAVYIPKGEHDDPHKLLQQDIEGSTKIENTLYSHTDTKISTLNSSQKLDYIYQHFQDNEKIYESDPKLVSCETDNTVYPHINNNIEYGMFEDVIDSYYLDSQIKDDFTCDQNCHTKTQYKQQDQTVTPCTHACDHITQYINNLEDPTQQHTVYTHEVDASLFTTDTATVCEYNIMTDFTNSDNILKAKLTLYNQWEFIPEANINSEMFLAILTSNIMILIMVMHSLSKINTLHYYSRNFKTLIGVYMILLQPKVTKYLLKWT